MNLKVVSYLIIVLSYLGTFQISYAQWVEIEGYAGKGFSGSTFVIQTHLEVVKKANKSHVKLTIGDIRLKPFNGYRDASESIYKVKSCWDGELIELQLKNLGDDAIGTPPFERIVATAWGVFDLSISIGFPKKYGALDVTSTGTIEDIKNVKKNSVYWLEAINEDFEVEDVSFVGTPRLVEFGADESLLQPAIDKYIQTLNEYAEADCLKRNQKKQQTDEKDKQAEKKIQDIKKKLSSTSQNNDKDFWAGNKLESLNQKTTPNDTESGSTKVVIDSKGRMLYLKRADDTLIKQWSMDNYNGLKKLDKAGDYYQLSSVSKGAGYLGQNKHYIVDKNGQIITVGEEAVFANVEERKDGGYDLEIYKSESLYHDKFWLGRKFGNQLYQTAEAAIGEVKANIVQQKKEQDEKNKNKSPGTVTFGWVTQYNVIKVSTIITNSTMKPILIKTGFQIQ